MKWLALASAVTLFLAGWTAFGWLALAWAALLGWYEDRDELR